MVDLATQIADEIANIRDINDPEQRMWAAKCILINPVIAVALSEWAERRMTEIEDSDPPRGY